jgi:hypothetical protein
MRGFVVKSHIFPTAATAAMLADLEPSLQVIGGMACNPPVGGLNPMAVEMCAQTGGRIIWMPTWAARHDQPHPNIFRERMRPYIGYLDETDPAQYEIGIFDSSGSLRPEVDRILGLCRSYDLVLATGHLPIGSSLTLAEEARSRGVKLLLTHPLSGSVGATIDQQRAFSRLGGTIEHVFVGCMPMHQRMDPRRIVEAIEAVGPEHIVLGSDAIEGWNPPAPELMRMFIGTLLALGVEEKVVHLMTHDNPERLFGLAESRTEMVSA